MPKIEVKPDEHSIASMQYGSIAVKCDSGGTYWVSQSGARGSDHWDMIHITERQVQAVAEALLNLKARRKKEMEDREAVPGRHYRHLKTGNVYRVQAIATEESTGDEVVVYASVNDGRCWTRPRAKFEDGRFEREYFLARQVPPKFGEDDLD